MKCVILLFTAFILSVIYSFGQDSSGKFQYLNEKPPGLVPVKFAPGVVSLKDQFEFGSVFSKDGKTFYYAVNVDGRAEIRFMKLKNNTWTAPERLIISDSIVTTINFYHPTKVKFISFPTCR